MRWLSSEIWGTWAGMNEILSQHISLPSQAGSRDSLLQIVLPVLGSLPGMSCILDRDQSFHCLLPSTRTARPLHQPPAAVCSGLPLQDRTTLSGTELTVPPAPPSMLLGPQGVCPPHTGLLPQLDRQTDSRMVGSEHASKECVAGGGRLQGLLEMGGGLGASPRSQRAEEMGGAFHAAGAAKQRPCGRWAQPYR